MDPKQCLYLTFVEKSFDAIFVSWGGNEQSEISGHGQVSLSTLAEVPRLGLMTMLDSRHLGAIDSYIRRDTECL